MIFVSRHSFSIESCERNSVGFVHTFAGMTIISLQVSHDGRWAVRHGQELFLWAWSVWPWHGHLGWRELGDLFSGTFCILLRCIVWLFIIIFPQKGFTKPWGFMRELQKLMKLIINSTEFNIKINKWGYIITWNKIEIAVCLIKCSLPNQRLQFEVCSLLHVSECSFTCLQLYNSVFSDFGSVHRKCCYSLTPSQQTLWIYNTFGNAMCVNICVVTCSSRWFL